MRVTRVATGALTGGPILVVGVGLMTLIVAACAAAPPSTSPSSGPSTVPATSPPASIEPTASATATPTAAPIGTVSWVSAGALAYPWIAGEADPDSAVQLADGRVLVVGGPADAEQPTAPAAQLWDPATNGWTETTGLERRRSAFAMVALPDGRALVIGGLNDDWSATGAQSYSSAYAFDPSTQDWSKVGLMTTARTAPAATLLSDGRVLVAGGYFHTGSEEAAAAPDDLGIVLAAHRRDPTAVPLPSRPPLQDVDISPYGYALATAEIFDPVTDTWSATGPMRYARVGARMATLADGRVLVVGSTTGRSVTGLHPDAYVTAEIYDPSTGRFTDGGRLPPVDRAAIEAMGVTLPEERTPDGYSVFVELGPLVAEPDGSAVLIGYGYRWRHGGGVDRSFRFEPRSRAWTELERPCARSWPPGDQEGDPQVVEGGCWAEEEHVGLADGRVLAIGGVWFADTGEWPDASPSTHARLLEASTVTWTEIDPLPSARMGGVAVPLDDSSVLVFGGLADGEYGREAVRFFAPR